MKNIAFLSYDAYMTHQELETQCPCARDKKCNHRGTKGVHRIFFYVATLSKNELMSAKVSSHFPNVNSLRPSGAYMRK